ncbi:acyl--CoA ligase [Streptomyces sp. NBC_01498]|uniref:class I adenylate-forming enzyme family protein n=1 Tax=Streptomyces sp. NBC_01498 TaxID=2975870 RepID=UPI002E7ABA8E|nr:class I adenylate-forming enzyme family protein [Streptomyces sp. NBC_01498]WTL26329.1 acyl--CoA ligase [Streptomyces sp. NBC_01498]
MPDPAALTAPGAPFEVVRTENGSLLYADGPRTLREFAETTWAYGDRPFLVGGDGDHLLTYGDFFAAATVLANRFVDSYGLRPGDRAAVLMEDRPEWPVAFWAAQLAGLVAVPLDAGWTGEEGSAVLEHCDPRVLLVDGAWLPGVRAWAGRTRARVVVVGATAGEAPGAPVERYEDLPAPDRYAAPPDIEIRAEDDATILYASDGAPLRGAVSTQLAQAGATMDVRFRAAADALERGDLPGLGPAPAVRLDGSFTGPAALAQMYGAMASGGTLVLGEPGSGAGPVPAHAPAAPAASPAVESRVAPGTGEVWLRGQSLPYAYWRDERATAESFTADGWFRAG